MILFRNHDDKLAASLCLAPLTLWASFCSANERNRRTSFELELNQPTPARRRDGFGAAKDMRLSKYAAEVAA